MYNFNNPAGSPPLPDILGQYYCPSPLDMYGTSPPTGLSYDPVTGASISCFGPCGANSPPIARRRRYSIGGIPSATAMNEFYNFQSAHNQSATNIANLLNEANKSISRSSQILNLNPHQRMTCPYGRPVSSYPQLNLGETSPYLNDNLMQMSTSFSSQPNMYFQYDKPSTAYQQQQQPQYSRLRPAVSSTQLNYPIYNMTSSSYQQQLPPHMTHSSYQTLQQPTATQYQAGSLLGQQRNQMHSFHASNPALSQYHQHHLHQYPYPLSSISQAYQQNLQHQLQQQQQYNMGYPQQSSQYGTGTGGGVGGAGLGLGTSGGSTAAGALHQQIQQQMLPQHHQFHIQQQLQQLNNSNGGNTGPGIGLVSSGTLGASGTSGAGFNPSAASAFDPMHPSHHLHHPQSSTLYHVPPYSKLDLDYNKPPENKRQVSFKFDVDTLSIDS